MSAILFSVLLVTLSAQGAARQPVRTSTPMITPVQVPDTSQLVALRAQLETIREYNESFFSVIQWGLGTVAGVAILLVGYGWFAQHRNYERDRDSLTRELTGIIATRLADLSAELRSVIDSKAKDLTTAVRNLVRLKQLLNRLRPKLRWRDTKRTSSNFNTLLLLRKLATGNSPR
jgi:hypothetical protein